jgi:endonuclease YncB( thermonuclease family)
MYPYERINTYGIAGSRRSLARFPLIFVLGLAAGALLPVRPWASLPVEAPHDQLPPPAKIPAQAPAARSGDTIWKRAGNPEVRHPVEVVRTIDGDTFEARVHLWPGLEMTTRVRLRGIDAPELKAACPQELQMAEAAGSALRGLLEEGEVTIYNIGPDKYNGRVVADAATRRTESVSAALLAGGFARRYGGGRRGGWCDASLNKKAAP